jgi:hypothetical protein
MTHTYIDLGHPVATDIYILFSLHLSALRVINFKLLCLSMPVEKSLSVEEEEMNLPGNIIS